MKRIFRLLLSVASMQKLIVPRAWIPVLFLSVATACAGFMQTAGPVSEPDSQLTFAGAEIAEVEGARIAFESTVGPTDFFKALRRTETPSGTKYMRDSDVVRFFPNHLVIVVSAVDTAALSKKKVSRDGMNELHFDGHWKRGIYLRPVKNLALQSKLPNYFSGWKYYLDLNESEVPLDDHLILDILSGDHLDQRARLPTSR